MSDAAVERAEPAADATPGEPKLRDADYRDLRALIHQTTGISLGEGKRQLVVSRLGRRLRKLGCKSFADYLEHLRERDPQGSELGELTNAITTNKTSFFREPHHFELLARQAAPAVAGGKLLVWSAACSSGEEPYSIALALREAHAEAPGRGLGSARILATDIDTDILARSEAGIYPLESAAALGEARMRRGFLRGRGDSDGEVRVRPELRAMIAFRRLNLIAPQWPLRATFDVIFCRNVLIYFDRPTQAAVVGRLLARLRPGGLLFLGHSESLLGLRPELKSLGQTAFTRTTAEGSP